MLKEIYVSSVSCLLCALGPHLGVGGRGGFSVLSLILVKWWMSSGEDILGLNRWTFPPSQLKVHPEMLVGGCFKSFASLSPFYLSWPLMGPWHLKNTGRKRGALKAKVVGIGPPSTEENTQSNTVYQFRFVALSGRSDLVELKAMRSLEVGRLWDKMRSLGLESSGRKKEQSSRRVKENSKRSLKQSHGASEKWS